MQRKKNPNLKQQQQLRIKMQRRKRKKKKLLWRKTLMNYTRQLKVNDK